MWRTTLALAGLWGLTGLAAVIIFIAGASNAPLVLRETVLYQTEPIGEIRGAQTVGQTFVAPYNGLYRIDISLADYGRTNTGPVIFRLKPARELPTVLVEQSFAAETIRGDTLQTLEFEPILDSAGRTYYFELTAPTATEGNALTAYIRPHNPYEHGSAYWQGRLQTGDLVFEAHFRLTGIDRLAALFQQITAGKPWLWSSHWLYVVLGAAWLGALLVALRQFTRIHRGARASEDAPSATRPFVVETARPIGSAAGLRIFVLALMVLVWVRSLLFSSIIPPWLGPDEAGHFEYVALIHTLRRIPAPLPETEIIPALTREINASAEAMRYEQFFDLWRTFGIRSLSEQEPPRLVGPREAGYQRPFFYVLLTPLYALVAEEPVLVRYFALAAASGGLAALTIGLVARTAAALFPGSVFIQALAPCLVAFWPTQNMMASRINNDNLATAVAALALWVIVMSVQRGLTWKNALGLGGCLALAILTKGTTVFLVPLLSFAFLLATLRRWGGYTQARNRVMVGMLAAAAGGGSVLLLVVLIWPAAAHWLVTVIEMVLWPSRSRDWIVSSLNVIATQPVLTPVRLNANMAEMLRLLMLIWFPYGWRSWLPTEWLALAGWVFAVALWLGGIAWLGIGSAARRLASSCQPVDSGRLWALGLLALAIPLAFSPLLTRMVIDPFMHWWNGRILMTLLTPASIFVAFGLKAVTPKTIQLYAWHSVTVLLILVDAFCLGYVILPGYYG